MTMQLLPPDDRKHICCFCGTPNAKYIVRINVTNPNAVPPTKHLLDTFACNLCVVSHADRLIDM